MKANGAFLGKRPETPSFGAVALLGIKSGLLRLRLLALRTVDRPGDFLGSFFDLFLENFDCFFQLGVFPVGKVIGGDIDDDMGDCSVEFHVFTILREEPAAARETHTAEIEDVGRTGRDDSSGGWDSHDFTTIQSLDGVEKDLGVGEGIFVAENEDQLGPAGVDVSVLRVTDVTVAPHGVGVQRMGENGEKVVRRESATVVPNVDDESVFAGSTFVNVMLKFFELVPHHAGDVEVAQFSFGGLFTARNLLLAGGF